MSLAVGIEIGGTKLQAGIGSGDGKLLALARRSVDPAKGGAGIREQIPSLVEEVLAKSTSPMMDIAGIGVGFGGPVDSKRGRILVSHQIEGWSDFPLRDWLAKKVEIPVVLQNDAKTAALAEAMHGAGKGLRRIFYITVGSGVGGGLVIDGVPDVGQGLGAGEIGHTWVPDPETGRPDKLEHVASGWSIGKRGSRRLGRDLSLLHPERFIIGGGVSLMGDLWWGPLKKALAERFAFKPFAQTFDVVPAALGEEVVVIGAVLLGLGST
jgi:glucokinase